MEITIIDFSGGSDGVTAMYISGFLHKYGDYYHDKIDYKIDGFIDGLKYTMGDKVIVNKISLHEDHPLVYKCSYMAETPPSMLSDINEEDRKNEND